MQLFFGFVLGYSVFLWRFAVWRYEVQLLVLVVVNRSSCVVMVGVLLEIKCAMDLWTAATELMRPQIVRVS